MATEAALGHPAPRRRLAALADRLEAVPVPRVFGLGRDTSVLFWTWLTWGLGAGLWSYFWPVYLSRLGADSVQVGLVIGSASLIATLVYLPGGFVAQVGYHKWQLVAAHLLSTVATGSFGLAQTWWQVLPGVLCSNLTGLLSPAISSYKVQAADEEGVSVHYAFSTIAAAQFVTMTISPPVGGWIADRHGMAAIFPLVVLAYGISVAGMCLARSRPLSAAPADGGDGAAAATRPGAWAAGWGAYRTVLGAPRVRLLLAAAFLVYAGTHVALSFAPLYLRQVYAYEATAIGWAGSAASAGAATLLFALERLRRRRGPVAAMVAACGGIGLHFGCVVVSPALAVQMLGFFCRGGFQAASTLTTVAVSEAVARRTVAPAVAVTATVAGLAAIVAPPIGGWLYAHTPAAPFAAGIAVLVAALPLIARAYRAAPDRSAVGRTVR